MAPTTRSRTTVEKVPTAPSRKNTPRAVKKTREALGTSSRHNTPSAKDDGKTKDKKEKDMCAICLDVMQGKKLVVRISPCAHKYHKKCCMEMLKAATEAERKCPLCRGPVAALECERANGVMEAVTLPVLSFQQFRHNYSRYLDDQQAMAMVNAILAEDDADDDLSWLLDDYEDDIPARDAYADLHWLEEYEGHVLADEAIADLRMLDEVFEDDASLVARGLSEGPIVEFPSDDEEFFADTRRSRTRSLSVFSDFTEFRIQEVDNISEHSDAESIIWNFDHDDSPDPYMEAQFPIRRAREQQ